MWGKEPPCPPSVSFWPQRLAQVTLIDQPEEDIPCSQSPQTRCHCDEGCVSVFPGNSIIKPSVRIIKGLLATVMKKWENQISRHFTMCQILIYLPSLLSSCTLISPEPLLPSTRCFLPVALAVICKPNTATVMLHQTPGLTSLPPPVGSEPLEGKIGSC